jgi:hypothetical protein
MAPEVTTVASWLSNERNTGPNSLRLGELDAKRSYDPVARNRSATAVVTCFC